MILVAAANFIAAVFPGFGPFEERQNIIPGPADITELPPAVEILFLPANVQQLLDRMTEGPQSLVHADVRLDNLFFATDPGADEVNQVALIDWQSVCSSCGEQDLAYFLTQSLPSELLASHGDALIERYHTQLLESGVTGYSMEDCRRRYTASAMYLMCYAVVISGTSAEPSISGNSTSASGSLASRSIPRSLNTRLFCFTTCQKRFNFLALVAKSFFLERETSKSIREQFIYRKELIPKTST